VTVVAAIARDGHVTMAADTCSQYQGTIIHGARKIRRMQTADGTPVLLTGSGNGAIVQVIPRLVDIEATPGADGSEQAWDEWAERVAAACTEAAAGTALQLTARGQDGSTTLDGAFLLGAAGRLWYLFTFQALRVRDGVAALGSGSDLAFGALTTYQETAPGTADDVVVAAAVRAAVRYDAWCSIDDDGPQIETVSPR
jgi:ATP-dependent protease HslVU (ClpYQ) peptidase subunit